MQVRDLESRDIEDVYQVLSTNGWAHRVPDVEYLRRIVEASQRSCVAIERGKVVGFARAITDGLSNGYLSMVVVAEPHRRQGVGKALVNESSTRTHRSPGFSEQGGMGRVSSLLRLVFLSQATRWNDYVVEAASGPEPPSS